jgi:L-glutamine:2-deoxy-scyllo-inosose/3-amino-2,3-dideoxy-scyllo-inosose aminotransferase
MGKSVSQSNRPAALGGAAAVDLPRPVWPVVDDLDVHRTEQVVRSGNWSWLGEHEMAFCRDFAAYIGTRHCLCLANGTVTLQCALQAVGVGPGDEVIVPGLTWVATAQAALDIGADVVLVDIDPETLCVDPACVEAAVTPRTKAVIPVHLFGCMCDMDAIGDVARRHGLKIVEDVAHQHGSEWRGRRAGSLGDAGSFSFQQSKVLTSGEGGAVVCDDEDVYRTCFALKQVGWTPDPQSPAEPGEAPALIPGNHYGHNYRITEMQAVLLRGGLTRLEAQVERREAAAARIRTALDHMGGALRMPAQDKRVTRQSYYCLTMLYDAAEADGLHRDAYLWALQAEGVPVGGAYPPVYRSGLLNLYDQTSPVPFRPTGTVQDYANLRLPNVERAVEETAMLLPHSCLLGDDPFIDQLMAAVAKVNDNIDDVRQAWASRSEQ